MMILRTDFGGTKLRKLNAATTDHTGTPKSSDADNAVSIPSANPSTPDSSVSARRTAHPESSLPSTYRLNGGLPAFVQISAMKTDSVSFRVNDLGHKSFIEGVIP